MSNYEIGSNELINWHKDDMHELKELIRLKYVTNRSQARIASEIFLNESNCLYECQRRQVYDGTEIS